MLKDIKGRPTLERKKKRASLKQKKLDFSGADKIYYKMT